MSAAAAHEAHDAEEHGAHGDERSTRLLEWILFALVVGAAGYALFGPKSPPKSEPEEPAVRPAAVSSARVAPGARQPLLASSVLSPRNRAEMQTIQAARRALSQNRPDDALKELQNYEREFAGGRLQNDATLLRLEAHLKKGDRATATKLAKELSSKAPNSRQARRAERLLSGEPPSAPKPAAR